MILLLALALLLVPSTAQAACGVPSARAEYETPEAQVYERGTRVLACHRPTGKARTLGVETRGDFGTDESIGVNDILGRRWVWTTMLGSYAESSDVRADTLTDLRTGRSVDVNVEDENTIEAEAIAVPGALVLADDVLTAHFIGGRKQVLSTEAGARALAVVGSRLYWRVNGAARTTVLELPAAAAPAKRPLARTVGRCKPKRGARLIESLQPFVLSRAGGSTWACRSGRTRLLARGDVTEARVVGEREVAYARPGFVGVLDVVSGTRRELPSTDAPLAANNLAVFSGGAAGLDAWIIGKKAPAKVAAEPASEVAVSSGDGTFVYWLDATGTPHSAEIRP